MQQQNTDCVVAIGDLPIELSRMRCGELYWIGAANLEDSRTLIRQILAGAPDTARAALIGKENLNDLISALGADEGPVDLRSYAWTGVRPKSLRALTKDLDRSLRPRGRTLILALPVDIFPADDLGLRSLLAGWRLWLQANGCTLLLAVYGGEIRRFLAAVLAPLNDVLAGAAIIEPAGQNAYLYKLEHWRNTLAVTGPISLALTKAQTGFTVEQHSDSLVLKGNDHEQFYIERSVLEGVPMFMASDWHVFDTALDVFERAQHASAATVVFCLQPDTSMAALARSLHTLRSQRGSDLKLVVRAMRRGLRYQDEQLLLASGATLTIPTDATLPFFFSLLESVQGQTYQRELAPDLDALLERYSAAQIRGVVSASRFLEYLEAYRSMPDSAPVGVLLVMKPVPGVAPWLALQQLSLWRMGDVACEQDGMVYLFLYGSHPRMVERALANVFRLPYREIFSDHEVCFTAAQIQNKCLELRTASQGAVVSEAAPEVFDDSPAVLTEQHAGVSGTTARLEPRRAALPLKKQDAL